MKKVVVVLALSSALAFITDAQNAQIPAAAGVCGEERSVVTAPLIQFSPSVAWREEDGKRRVTLVAYREFHEVSMASIGIGISLSRGEREGARLLLRGIDLGDSRINTWNNPRATFHPQAGFLIFIGATYFGEPRNDGRIPSSSRLYCIAVREDLSSWSASVVIGTDEFNRINDVQDAVVDSSGRVYLLWAKGSL